MPLQEGHPGWHADFWIPDAEEAAAAQAVELGGAVLQAPYDAPPFKEAVLSTRRADLLGEPAGGAAGRMNNVLRNYT